MITCIFLKILLFSVINIEQADRLTSPVYFLQHRFSYSEECLSQAMSSRFDSDYEFSAIKAGNLWMHLNPTL